MRRPTRLFLFALFAAFALLTLTAANAEITDAEARLLWIVRDPERVEPAAVGDTARLLLRNFRAMLDRAQARDLPLAVPLDLWTTVSGGSAFAARLALVLLVCIAASATQRLLWRRRAARMPLALAVVIGPALLLGSVLLASRPPAAALVGRYVDERHVAEPVVTLFSDQSPAGYYHARHNLRRGIGVDLGWRDFSDDEIARVVANLGSGPVWMISDPADGRAVSLWQALEATGRAPVWCDDGAALAAVRFVSGAAQEAAGCT